MTNVVTVLFIFLSTIAHSQIHHHAKELVNMATTGLTEQHTVAFNEQTNSLQIDEWNIPVSKNTLVKLGKKSTVEFLLQRGTAVTSSNDPQVKKAWFSLSFTSRKSAKAFINAFNQVAELSKD